MVRVLHFSDVHVDVPVWRMPLRGMLNKRMLGGANLVLRRARRFRDAVEKLAKLADFAAEREVDLCVCTGDYTALGTEPELVAARQAVQGLTERPLGYVTVPGNHDVYMPDGVRDGRFERNFGDLLGSDWPEATVDGRWPAVRLIGDHLAIVAVNSARPNPQPWRSSGRIPAAQLAALSRILRDQRLLGRAIFIATHYAPRLRDGSPDRREHGLENADALLMACEAAPRVAILHGHVHWRFHVRLPDRGPRLFGAGSATDAGRESFWLFEVDADEVVATPGEFADGRYRLDDRATIAF